MANRKVKRLKLDSIIIKKLEKHNVSTCKDVLNKTFLELLKITGVSYSQVNTVLQTASISCAPKPISALDLLQQAEEEAAFMTTSFKQLDEILHGGLPTSSITEIAGPAGCGKTQLSILYCVEALFSASTDGKDASVIYIDTEGAFSAERLVEIAQCRYPDHFSTNEALIHLTNHLFIYLETTCSSLLKRFHSLEEEIIQNRVKLIIVDSIASLVRKEFDSSLSGNFIHRSNILGKQAIHLKYLAKSFNIPVVVTNQITTRMRSVQQQCTSSLQTRFNDVLDIDGYVTAALGDSWTHSVNTRLVLQYVDQQQRQIVIAKSPIAQVASVNYVIEDKGPTEVSDSLIVYDSRSMPLLDTIKVQHDANGHQIPYEIL